ncbi:alpha/beta hydrolase [Glaciecola sp. MF2-115]|uniref:alpha/beta hydrolase n=1 Tax=Glaciecola sp. MF2-115 TaxID=3384827 RepID=UPI0039A2CE2B
MLKLILFVALVSVFLQAQANQNLRFESTHEIKSKVLEEQRTYYVYLPPSYHSSNNRYPVIYVLDGDMHRFKAISGMLEGLSTDTLEKQVQEAIVVAIPNSENAIRERDLTPTNIKQWTFKDKVLQEFDGDIGNANKYISFFSNELIPEINKTYRTSSKRVLIGESFGGLFAAYALISEPSTFSDYLIIDPTSLWDNNYLNKAIAKARFSSLELSADVFIGFANNAALGDIGLTNLAWGREFYTNLSMNKSEQFNVKEQYFEQETHGTVALLSWYHGLRYLLASNDN